ncbi:hypothetical protein [Streptomyces johnsoniae]|uniref:Uncharacterized protein n=1 Tax=Streptomyces johnsoniae TaxID=3075532 RepID=A0ABU2RY74_9ACTN|nr:hypothetical protein [Streptomyces sp. DSM 41886]MDT0441707.1 hypothetical protein [Streptomyces sp. DSM 41886]
MGVVALRPGRHDGADALHRAEVSTASGTVRLGQRLLAWLTGNRPDGTDGLARAVTDLADGGGEDEQAALRLELRKLLRDDEDLRREFAALLPERQERVGHGAGGRA